MTSRAVVLAALVAITGAVAGCGDAVQPDPIGDYTAWYKVETWGNVPGHGDSYRIIYANDVARTYRGGQYPEGTILVKEVYDRAGTADAPAPGKLQYVAIMRRLGAAPEAYTDEGGWLFTATDKPGGDETHYGYCWNACHAAAPYSGAWLDYSR